MFNAAIFWASIGGWGGALLVAVALLICMCMTIEEDEFVLGAIIGTPIALLGITGIALSLALTDGWSV